MESRQLTSSEVWTRIHALHTVLPCFPSVAHCCGKGKLLGSEFAPALDRYLGGRVLDLELTRELCEVGRAWLVIDDYHRDSPLSLSQSEATKALLDRLEDHVLKLGTAGFADFASIWHRRKALQEHTFDSFDMQNFYAYKINKCSIAFWCLDLDIVRASGCYAALKKCLHDYFFALSLADDFNDMEEDLASPHNDNLFVAGQDLGSAEFILSHRKAILWALIPFILKNLRSVEAAGGDFERFYKHACMYLRNKVPAPVDHVLNLFSDSFETYSFDVCSLRCVAYLDEGRQYRIAAEEMHTPSMFSSLL